jgi:hypothetical protein
MDRAPAPGHGFAVVRECDWCAAGRIGTRDMETQSLRVANRFRVTGTCFDHVYGVATSRR